MTGPVVPEQPIRLAILAEQRFLYGGGFPLDQ